MKSYCKNVDITDYDFCLFAVREFLKGKRSRFDVVEMLKRLGGEDGGASFIAASIRDRAVGVEPIKYFNRVEPISGKHRVIGRESALHQCYDYVAVFGLMELFDAKIGRYQTASLPGKGQIFAKKAIEKWIRESEAKYFVKLDIRKYYPSISQEALRFMLKREVRNEALLYLTFYLLDQFPQGLNIGSFLSQYLANYYASKAYHFAQERLRKERKSKRAGEITSRRLIDHCLFYMDDILLMGHDKSDLKIAVRMLAGYMARTLQVELKPWKICVVDKEPIDMVGYVFYSYKTIIRPGIFVRAMRAFRKARKADRITLHLAYRCISYYGYFKNSDSRHVIEKYHIDLIVRECRDVVSLAGVEGRLNERLFPGRAEAGRLEAAPRRLRRHPPSQEHREGDARADLARGRGGR